MTEGLKYYKTTNYYTALDKVLIAATAEARRELRRELREAREKSGYSRFEEEENAGKSGTETKNKVQK